MNEAGGARGFEARVVAAYGRQFIVADDAGRQFSAVRRARRGDVVVGDRVRCAPAGAGQAVVEAILPRSSLLYRTDAWRSKELAANVDQVAVVYAARPAFNLHFLWRALLAAAAADLPSLVVLNKIDLDGSDVESARAALGQLAALGHATLAVSARMEPEAARTALEPRLRGRATLLVGQSGMGKSTLLNLLVPEANARTEEYSTRLNLGRHTTTASRWFATTDGALIDTPGFQSFGLAHLPIGSLAAFLPDFAPHLGRCRFLDCRHADEPDCSVRAAVAAGAIDQRRYAFYRELLQESR